MAAFTCWCLPYLAKMSTIFILLYISLHSGFWFFIMLAKFGKNLQFSKNGNQNPQWNVLWSTIKTLCKFYHIWICWDWMIDVANFGYTIRLSNMECCAFIRHLVIEFANNGKALKLPKMNVFQSKRLHIWQLLDLLEVAFSLPWNIPLLDTIAN